MGCRVQGRRAGFNLLELIVVIVVAVILLAILQPFHQRAICQGNLAACTGNLKQIGIGLELYKQGPGKNRTWPQANGSAFLMALYVEGVISEPNVFICPSTDDQNGNPHGAHYGAPGSDPRLIDSRSVSYAGRANDCTSAYFISSAKGLAETPIASDDMESPGERKVTPNHQSVFNVLYGDYHVNRLDWRADLQRRTDCIGPGGVPPLDALRNDSGVER